jgi:hypothetical protein
VVEEDADLTFKLVTVLLGDERLSEARQALDRYQLEPGTEQEMRFGCSSPSAELITHFPYRRRALG